MAWLPVSNDPFMLSPSNCYDTAEYELNKYYRERGLVDPKIR